MKVLVAFATRHGSTAGIAERIAKVLTECGHAATAVPVEEAGRPTDYDAVVLGGAAYLAHWLEPVVRYAHDHRQVLAQRPVWLFSSGPLGTETTDPRGVDARTAARPREFDELTRLLAPRGERVFFGAYDPTRKPVGLGERVVRHLPAARNALPAGDFRDWDDIEGWARQIATDLTRTRAGA